MAKTILLSHRRAPGDIVCMTACVRDLVRTYPNLYDVHVWTSCQSLWKHNPYVAGSHGKPIQGMKRYDLTYGHHINQANRKPLHFLTAFHRNMQEQLNIDVPVLEPYGDLHLSDWHKQNSPVDGRYWYYFAGGKSDFTTKIWSSMRHQQAINILKQFGHTFVQGGAHHSGHWHPLMEGVLNLVNCTNLRDMMWLIYHADGVVCTITAAMHVAAAFQKPCVVTAGGREHWWWEAYVNTYYDNFGPHASRKVKVPHKFLHTQGLLDCCRDRGCWKNKVTKTQKDKRKSYCKYPISDTNGQVIPQCMDMLKVEHVVDAVRGYYESGMLPDLNQAYTGYDHEQRLTTDPLFKV